MFTLKSVIKWNWRMQLNIDRSYLKIEYIKHYNYIFHYNPNSLRDNFHNSSSYSPDLAYLEAYDNLFFW